MGETSRLRETQKINLTVNGENGKKRSRSARSKQKSVSCRQRLVGKFSEPDVLVVDLFSCSFATRKSCFELQWHRRLVIREADAY